MSRLCKIANTQLLSYLPNAGFPVERLAKALEKPTGEIENLLQLAVALGVVSLRPDVVRFSHDRQRLAAQSLIRPEDSGALHKKVFQFLTRPDMADHYLFDSAEQALFARTHGTAVASDHVIVTLLLNSSRRASEQANFTAARHFVEQAQSEFFASQY